ncbi:shikimate dehydrogenase [Nocardiopsis salina]|uniref:shikimate dehydrogenase n=1 Tax=Nocardiopsis salina TaxID=245836 RepID=UPI00034ADA69|nr:shikimate dehydrogenase [Nocardiopsis salina]
MSDPLSTRPEGVAFLLGLIGSGIGPSLTPPMHEREAAELGRPLEYRTLDIDELGSAPEDVGELMRSARRLGFDGLNITHPCKQLALHHLDGLTPDAQALGAVNTVVFGDSGVQGHNTDWSAFARSLESGLPGAPKDRVLLLGTGGAGAAVGYALMRAGTGELDVADPDPDRAELLAANLRGLFPGRVCRAVPTRHVADTARVSDGLVNASPVGMAHHPGTPLPTELLRPSMWVVDVVYRPLETELLAAARQLGCRVLSGKGMAVHQAAEAFGLITGLVPDRDRMLAHFDGLERASAPA